MKSLSKNIARLLYVITGLGLAVSNSVPRAMDNNSQIQLIDQKVDAKEEKYPFPRPISKQEYEDFKNNKTKLYRDENGALRDKQMGLVCGQHFWKLFHEKYIEMIPILKMPTENFENDIKLHPLLDFINKNKNELGLKKVGSYIFDRNNKLLIYDFDEERAILTDSGRNICNADHSTTQTYEFKFEDFGLSNTNDSQAVYDASAWINKKKSVAPETTVEPIVKKGKNEEYIESSRNPILLYLVAGLGGIYLFSDI